MRFSCSLMMGLVALAASGCGPGRVGSLEGFGEGESGDGDGDTNDEFDTESGDGDGDPGDCIEINYGSAPEIFFEGENNGLPNDFPGWCAETPGSDFAFAWTAPFSGSFRTILNDNEQLTWLSILEGGCDGELYTCGQFGFSNILDFEAIEGQSYTFVIDSAVPGWFAFEMFPLGVMPETCPHGFVNDWDTVFGSTVGGAFDYASDCGGDDAPDRTYIFYPEQTGTYRVDTFGSTFDTILHVLEGECFGSIFQCNDDWGDTTESYLEFEAIAGQPYTIVVDGFGGSQGAYQLNIQALDDLPELCDDITMWPSEPTWSENWSTFDSSADAIDGCIDVPFERRFYWQAPASGDYRLTQLVDGPSGVTIVPDGCAGEPSSCAGNPGGEPVTVNFAATVGQEFVFVSEWGAVDSDEISLAVAPAGSCNGADLGSIVPIAAQTSTLGGGDDHMGSCATNPAPDIEYLWTAPTDGSYRFTLEGSSYDTLLILYLGGCEGVELGCNDDTPTPLGLQLWSTIEVDLAAGTSVGIVVDGYDNGGNFILSISQL